ncbi:hypothetical protein C6P45_003031 [Maudiozyma exigua]|uniref:Uncharacterized protein n=1 Tax=Maudiozyma exigua TaxID=34358 RepID=A0A9P7BDY0_MAUEX|nr:hypothetical protein C6P45_003031 [Kazachstania exigua]
MRYIKMKQWISEITEERFEEISGMEEPYWTKDYISGIRLFVSDVTNESQLIENQLQTIKRFNDKCYKPMLSQLKQIESLVQVYGLMQTRNIDNQLTDLLVRCQRLLHENKLFHEDFMKEVSPLYNRYYDSLNKLRSLSPSLLKIENDSEIDIASWITYPYMLDSQISINSRNEMIQYVQYVKDNINMIQQYKLLGNKRYFHGNELINVIRGKYPLVDTSQFNSNRLGQDMIEMGLIEEYSSRRLYMSKAQLTYDIERDYIWLERREEVMTHGSSNNKEEDFLSQYIIVEENKINLEVVYCKNCSYYDQNMKPGIITTMKRIQDTFSRIITEQLFKDITLKPEEGFEIQRKVVYGCGYYIRDNGVPIIRNNVQFLFGQITYNDITDIVESIDLIMKQCCKKGTFNQSLDIWHGEINLMKASKLKIMILTKFYHENKKDMRNSVVIQQLIDETDNTTIYHPRDWSDLIKLWLNELPGGILLYDTSIEQIVVSQSYKEIFSVIVKNLREDATMESIARMLDIDSGGQIMIQSLIRDYNRNSLSMKQLAAKICQLIMNWDCDQHVMQTVRTSSELDFIPLPYKTTPRI